MKNKGINKFLIFLGVIIAFGILVYLFMNSGSEMNYESNISVEADSESIADENKKEALHIEDIPEKKVLLTNYHVFQTFNNCAAAGLSMALRFYDIKVSQGQLADEIRPNHNNTGINDNKSTPPPQLAAKAEEYGLVPYYRANGDIELIKKFIANGIPVMVRTLLNTYEDYAHYRVIKGYDEAVSVLIQDDSYQGKNIRYSYVEFNKIWKPFNYEYLVFARPEQMEVVESILSDEVNEMIAWQNAVLRAKRELQFNPNDVKARFNLAISLFYVDDKEESIKEYEKIESQLPMRALWYRLEPVQAYFDVENYDKVFSLSEKIFFNNKGYAELYLLRGKIYLERGDKEAAKREFEKAVFYAKNSIEARKALQSVQ